MFVWFGFQWFFILNLFFMFFPVSLLNVLKPGSTSRREYILTYLEASFILFVLKLAPLKNYASTSAIVSVCRIL